MKNPYNGIGTGYSRLHHGEKQLVTGDNNLFLAIFHSYCYFNMPQAFFDSKLNIYKSFSVHHDEREIYKTKIQKYQR
jgi:hypothetical protein